ncbi:hypothetical protein CALVIDRAFT_560439 [Calocera viscosa TUFC12733]|uniref:TAP-C domain-containing protein n=1 Tax=Calocera viscosa (strain TUFC12733) TaxID=1330018 RepID=A0A167R1W8_CALVF|nr:hypothetical protein CALVIDRAFT_560439 [Calocera viscosa TUFC12733]
MADAKWASYREPPPVTGYEPKKMRKAPRGGEGGSTTGVGSSRRGGSTTLHGEDENMDGRPGSRRFDVLNRRGRPGGASGRPPQEDRQHVEIIKDFVQRKYNPAAQFLAFDDIFGDQILRQNGLTKWTASGTSQDRLADSLWKAASSLDPPVQTISAARNNMTRAQLQRIPQYLPGLRNLSLRENEIETIGDITSFFTRGRGGGLRHLQEIWLVGNPVRDKAEKFDDLDQYFYNVANAIRTLKVVDGQPMPSASWDIEENSHLGRAAWPDGQPFAVSFPVPMAPSSVDEHLRDMIGGILSQFFAFYDNDRKNLINAYHSSATFSVSTLPNTPPRQIPSEYKPERGTPASSALLKNLQGTIDRGMSRNLKYVTSAQSREVSLHTGHSSILELFDTLPPSRHPLQDGSKFVFDATLLPDMGMGDMLEVSVHGEFLEPIMNVVFSFNRTIIFVTAGAGSTAEKIGMNVLVMSDILAVRRPSPSTVWTPGPIISQGDEWTRNRWPSRTNNPAAARVNAPARAPAPVPVQPAPQPLQAAPVPNPFQAPAPTAFQQPAPTSFQQPQQPAPGFATPQPQQLPMQPPQPTPAPAVQQPPAPTPAGPAEIPPELESLTPAQRELAMAFSGVTGLIIPATLSVLGENGWDGDAAYSKLLEVKSAIPGEWWIGGAPNI